ncbi:MAG: PDZ domain-containing protein, partial [Pirellulaceae bacterium]
MKRRHHYRMALSLLVVTSVGLLALPNANGQGLLRRLRSRVQATAPPPQYRPPYQVQVPAKQAVVVPSSPVTQSGNATAGRTLATPNVIRIDPRTGRVVVVAPMVTKPTQSPPANASASNASASKTTVPTAPTPSASPTDRSQPATNEPPKQFGNSILQSDEDDSSTSVLPVRSSLGLTVMQATRGMQGLDVIGFRETSLADEAGLQLGDRILFLNGQPTPDAKTLGQLLTNLPPGQSVALRIGRGNRIGDIRVPLVSVPVVDAPETESTSVAKQATKDESSQTSVANLPEPAKSADSSPDNGVRLGVKITDQPGTRGVIVTLVEPNSPAEAAGFQEGDRIVSIDGRMVTDTDALARELSLRSAVEPMAVQLVRQNQLRVSTVSFKDTAGPADEPAEQSKLAGADEKSNNTPSKGIVGGVGSLLGGFFGGKETDSNSANASQANASAVTEEMPPTKQSESKTPQRTSATDASAENVGDVPGDAPSNELGPMPSVLSGPVTNAGLQKDEMAFGDEEPIDQVIFAQPVDMPAIPERKLDEEPSRREKPATL